MYAREQKAQLVKHGKRLNPDRKPLKGTNRRTVALIPEKKFAQADLLLPRQSSIYQRLLVIEANSLSCCVKITSPRSKARSAMLIYKGQVIGCVYGSKKNPDQLFGRAAFERIMSEITRFDNFIDGYILPENILLAAGSMFHEDVILADEEEPAADVARRALDLFKQSEGHGCLVLADENNVPQSTMFFSQSTLLGAQLLTSEKAPQDLNKLWQYLERHPKARVYASLIRKENLDNRDMTFGLSRLNEETTVVHSEELHWESTKLTLMHAMKEQKLPQPVSPHRFVNVNKTTKRPGMQSKFSSRFNGVGFYEVNPR